MEKYRVGGYGRWEIERREVLKESAQQITFVDPSWGAKGRREYKGNNWFDTEREAAQEIIKRLEMRLARAQDSVTDAERALTVTREKLRDALNFPGDLVSPQENVEAK